MVFYHLKFDCTYWHSSWHQEWNGIKCELCDYSRKHLLFVLAYISSWRNQAIEMWNLGFKILVVQKNDVEKLAESVHERKIPFNCKICNNTSLTASVHEGKKPHDWYLWSCSFSHKQALTWHIRSVHEVKKPFKPERIYNPITAMGFPEMSTFQLDSTKR